MNMDAKRQTRFRFLLALLALCTLATACASEAVVDTGSPTTVVEPNDDGGEPGDGTDATDPAQRLADARQKWAENGPATYVMTTRLQCFCPEIQWKNTVIDGQTVETVSVGEEQFIEPETQTMETLFDEVDTTIRGGYERLDLEFDELTGALISYWVDIDEMIADEEHGVSVTVSPIDDSEPEVNTPPATTSVDATAIAGLQVDHGCGFGFAKGNADQTLALVIYFTGEYTETGPDLSSPIVFPNDEWSAEVHAGSDLFSNWCDDAIEEDEPTPVIDSVWNVVGGTLTAAETESPYVVEGTLADAVIESPNGEQLEVAEIALSNTEYGFFAG